DRLVAGDRLAQPGERRVLAGGLGLTTTPPLQADSGPQERPDRRRVGRRTFGPGRRLRRDLLDRLDDELRRGAVEPQRPDEATQEPLVAAVVALAAQRGLELLGVLVEGVADVQQAEVLRLQI